MSQAPVAGAGVVVDAGAGAGARRRCGGWYGVAALHGADKGFKLHVIQARKPGSRVWVCQRVKK